MPRESTRKNAAKKPESETAGPELRIGTLGVVIGLLGISISLFVTAFGLVPETDASARLIMSYVMIASGWILLFLAIWIAWRARKWL